MAIANTGNGAHGQQHNVDEVYRGDAGAGFEVYQEITGLPAGSYKVTAQAFYRPTGTNEAAAIYDAADPRADVLAYLDANGAREKAKKTATSIKKLRDCMYHLTDKSNAHREEAEKSMIFLTEGDSASGTITKCRKAEYQAVFSLRGKLYNAEGQKRSIIYKHDELYNIMAALGIEDDIENLRYSKVVIATDADNDGFHIRNLIMTYFFTFFEELVTQGHLFILETPLFRVRNKQKVIYCYSEKERDEAVAQLKGAEITRFKGLGEIDPKEFGAFIGDDMRLVPVSISSLKETREVMNFCMGDNTPKRREYIMENLI